MVAAGGLFVKPRVTVKTISSVYVQVKCGKNEICLLLVYFTTGLFMFIVFDC